MDYIDGPLKKQTGCIFCTPKKKSTKERASAHVLFCGLHSVVMLNKFPYSGGHILIAPNRHISRIEDLTPLESNDIFRLMALSVEALKKEFKAEGFNIGMNIGKAAGAGIDDHIHLHVVPRWNGDTNFMPALGMVKVMPEHLVKTYKKLQPFFKPIV